MHSPIPASELILNSDGSVYHLHLRPEDIAPTIITVGDMNRVPMVSKYFDRIIVKKQKREFLTHTGYIGNQPISVISTGIGTDNIDIVFNELDALVNIDLQTRLLKSKLTQLTFIRIGTSGALQADIALDTFLASQIALGLDGLLHYYSIKNKEEINDFLKQLKHINFPIPPYLACAHVDLLETMAKDLPKGVTATCTGFYAPQSRAIRLAPQQTQLFQQLQHFQYQHHRITNFEMETAGIYGLAQLLGHRALSLNAILANRATHQFSQQPQKTVEKLIQYTLEKVGNSAYVRNE